MRALLLSIAASGLACSACASSHQGCADDYLRIALELPTGERREACGEAHPTNAYVGLDEPSVPPQCDLATQGSFMSSSPVLGEAWRVSVNISGDPWFATPGVVSAAVTLSVQTGFGGPCGEPACTYNGGSAPPASCALEVTRAAAREGDRVEARLREPCVLLHTTADPPRLLELELGGTVRAVTNNALHPGEPVSFACPL